MSWMSKLYQTYEYAQKQNLDDEDLALPFHMPKAAHLKVVLNDKGELVCAERFDGKKQVPIQVTEKSSKRSGSTIAPYALHDNLQYIAKTAEQYLTIEYLSKVAEKKAPQKGGEKWKAFLSDNDDGRRKFADSEKEKFRNSFECYEKQLSDWADFSGLKEIQAVLQYIRKGSLIKDLLSHQVFTIEEDILLSKKDDPFGFTIVWAVEIPGDPHAELWSKNSVQADWIRYQESMSEQDSTQKDLCYITGEQEFPVAAYPKIQGNAKLISANDTGGLTFLGRFLTDKQAVILGRDVSQKAFNVLKWLIKRQGFKFGDQVTVAWAISGKRIPSPLQDTFVELDLDNLGSSIGKTEAKKQPENQEGGIDWSDNIGKAAAEIIKRKMRGYRADLEKHEQISLLMLDSATPGRMALTYYQEFLPDDYFANLDAWVDDTAWYQRHSINKKQTVWPILPPSPYAVYETVYGKRGSDTLKKQLYARLLPVIAGGSSVPLPYDLVQKSFQAACNPSGCEHWEWQRNIGVACALYKGWRARHHDSSQKRIYSMDLDLENRSRDYLFGRLLAVAEKLESTALRIADEERATTAERYMQRFAVHPLSTWLQIETNLVKSYKDRLRNNRYMGFLRNREKEIDEIMSALNELRDQTGCSLDTKLDGEFLLGYHSQKMAYRNKVNAQVQSDMQDDQAESN
ncbi:CRISPR-associated protein, Csd1 family [Neisseria sp. oral taxon 020 str. F0370]|uniref:type I-C CRISPR-associated protein Cas8c/Csd1 n=1 Tax=unclassified Neisseria TaxID=2623750 RepID=UPI0002A44F73|nr:MULTISPECIES: type I-C CRISPR-associated protein Cas8c/Csd1 [unclassified Neisseria]ASP16405.1 type I-C CRISPR-associated protein Cas8c/Csd1 [Neisseria sp. KEM232]EKY02930.1 CRISPR-associated protein, Csd1 family [Neisseria sp. oral taxon 020 str. F0370]